MLVHLFICISYLTSFTKTLQHVASAISNGTSGLLWNIFPIVYFFNFRRNLEFYKKPRIGQLMRLQTL